MHRSESCHHTQHNDIQHNNTQHNNTQYDDTQLIGRLLLWLMYYSICSQVGLLGDHIIIRQGLKWLTVANTLANCETWLITAVKSFIEETLWSRSHNKIYVKFMRSHFKLDRFQGYKWRHGTQHNDIQHNNTQRKGLTWDSQYNDTQHNDTQHKEHYAWCHVLFIAMLSVVMLSVTNSFKFKSCSNNLSCLKKTGPAAKISATDIGTQLPIWIHIFKNSFFRNLCMTQ
jgi:hypothetical protein